VAEPESKGNGEPWKNPGEKLGKAAEKAQGRTGLRQRLWEKDLDVKRRRTEGKVEAQSSSGK